MSWALVFVVFLIVWISAIASVPPALQLVASVVAVLPSLLGAMLWGVLLQSRRELEVILICVVASLIGGVFAGITSCNVLLTTVVALVFSAVVAIIAVPQKLPIPQRIDLSRCQNCGYSTSGLTGTVCPECGRNLPRTL